MVNELEYQGFTNLTLIDKENFTSNNCDLHLASCGVNIENEISLKKEAASKFNFIFGRVREINYETEEGLKKEVVIHIT